MSVATDRVASASSLVEIRRAIPKSRIFGRPSRVTATLADLVQGADVGMIQRRCVACLVQEPIRRLRSVTRRQQLDGDQTIEPGVASAIHLPHTAGAQRTGDLVGPETGSCIEHHSEVRRI